MSETAASVAPVTPATPPVVTPTAAAAPVAPAAAPVKAPEAPAPQIDAIARTQAQFAQREIALTKERQKLAAERDQHKAELESAKQRAARLDHLEKLKATDPLAVLKELGLDYSTLTKEQIKANPEGAVKRADFDAWRREQDERAAAKEAASQKAAEEAKQMQERAAYQRSYEQHRDEARALVEGNREKYEVLLEDLPEGADIGEELLAVIEHDYRSRVAAGESDVKPLTKEEAADKANALAEKRAERVAAALGKKKSRTPAIPAEKTAPAIDAKAEVKDEKKPPVDKVAASVSDAAVVEPVFDPATEDFSDFIRRFRRWENEKKASK